MRFKNVDGILGRLDTIRYSVTNGRTDGQRTYLAAV